MRKIRISTLMIFMLVMILNVLHAQEKFLPEYRYEKGKTYKYRQNSKFESVLEMNGQEMKNVGNTVTVSRIEVQDVHANGDQAVTMTYEDFRVQTKLGPVDTTLVMKEMLGKGSRLLISRLGEVIEARTADDADSATGTGLGDQTTSDLSKELVRFPDYAIGIGDTWREERQDTASGTELVTLTRVQYSLAGEELKSNHPCLKITFSGTLEISGKMNQMGMEFFMEGEGEVSGTFWYDRNAGILVEKENVVTQDITMAMTGQMQMTIPMTTTLTGIFTLLSD